MTLLYTVQSMIDEVRDQLDESNSDAVSDPSILNSLNRGQTFAFDVLSRRYPEPIMEFEFVTLVSGQQDYTIPEDVFEDRILKVDIEIPGSGSLAEFREVKPISYRDSSQYESSSITDIPQFYQIYSRKIRFIGAPSGVYRARLSVLRDPEKFVIPQGRITRINTSSNYVIVDEAGDSLTTEADQLGSYVNFIDGQTGEILGTSQVQIIGTDSRITFRGTPLRSSVLNRTIEGDIGDFDPAISLDDYICSIGGSCVPYFAKPISNFCIQYSVAEITGKLGGERNLEEQVLEKFEKQVDKSSAGRPGTRTIKKTSRIWGRAGRSRYWNRG